MRSSSRVNSGAVRLPDIFRKVREPPSAPVLVRAIAGVGSDSRAATPRSAVLLRVSTGRADSGDNSPMQPYSANGRWQSTACEDQRCDSAADPSDDPRYCEPASARMPGAVTGVNHFPRRRSSFIERMSLDSCSEDPASPCSAYTAASTSGGVSSTAASITSPQRPTPPIRIGRHHRRSLPSSGSMPANLLAITSHTACSTPGPFTFRPCPAVPAFSSEQSPADTGSPSFPLRLGMRSISATSPAALSMQRGAYLPPSPSSLNLNMDPCAQHAALHDTQSQRPLAISAQREHSPRSCSEEASPSLTSADCDREAPSDDPNRAYDAMSSSALGTDSASVTMDTPTSSATTEEEHFSFGSEPVMHAVSSMDGMSINAWSSLMLQLKYTEDPAVKAVNLASSVDSSPHPGHARRSSATAAGVATGGVPLSLNGPAMTLSRSRSGDRTVVKAGVALGPYSSSPSHAVASGRSTSSTYRPSTAVNAVVTHNVSSNASPKYDRSSTSASLRTSISPVPEISSPSSRDELDSSVASSVMTAGRYSVLSSPPC